MKNLEKYFDDYLNLPFERILEKYRLKRTIELVSKLELNENDPILEIGAGLKSNLSNMQNFKSRTSLEPIKELYIRNKNYFPEIQFYNLTFEKYFEIQNFMQYKLILLNSVLHEMYDPEKELNNIKKILEIDGYLLIVVPNNKSIHRILGKELGILKDLDELTTTELNMQQNKSFSISTLTKLLKKIEFEIIHSSTSFVKPRTHKQMQQMLDTGRMDDKKLDMLYEISEIFEEYCSEIFMVVRKKDE